MIDLFAKLTRINPSKRKKRIMKQNFIRRFQYEMSTNMNEIEQTIKELHRRQANEAH